MSGKICKLKSSLFYSRLSKLTRLYDEQKISQKPLPKHLIEYMEKCISNNCIFCFICDGSIDESFIGKYIAIANRGVGFTRWYHLNCAKTKNII